MGTRHRLNAQTKPDNFAGGGDHAAFAVFAVGAGGQAGIAVMDDPFAIPGVQVILPKNSFPSASAPAKSP